MLKEANAVIVERQQEKTEDLINCERIPLPLWGGMETLQIFFFFLLLMRKKEKFVFQLRANDYKNEMAKLRSNDQYIDILITKNRVNHIKDEKLKSTLLKIGSLNLRIITVQIINGKTEYLIINLDKKILNTEI